MAMLSLLPTALLPGTSSAAESPPVTVESIQVTPATVLPGKYPDIIANIRMQASDPAVAARPVSIIAVLTQPDHRTKSWVWNKVVLAAQERKSYPLHKDYSTKLIGEYKIEYTVYSGDMKRRFSFRSAKFSVAEKPKDAAKPETKPEPAAAAPERKAPVPPAPAGYRMGVGVYGNVTNPAGGATVLVWPSRYVGLQATYTAGEFTSYEGRLLGKLVTASGWNPYAGVGYLSVSKTADVIGVSTDFSDSTVSGVLGVEIPLGRKFYGYAEVTGSGIDLKKTVTNGSQTAEATVEYYRISFGLGIVFVLF